MISRPQHPSGNPAASASPDGECVLTINGGSSSLKFAVFAGAGREARRYWGRVERIGGEGARIRAQGVSGQRPEDAPVDAPDLAAAAALVIERLRNRRLASAVAAVGHRVVHGGARFVATEVVSASMLDELRRISPFDPDHLPGEIALIEALQRAFPGVPQVACFDTAFHRDMPRVAQLVPIPRRFEAIGVRRYGFHGLSYGYLMEALERIAGPEQARGRVVLAHLGAGASLAAVHDGRCRDTTMGFTPASGLVMGTRCGDLDPGIPRYLAAAAGMNTERFHQMVNYESGLLGVSETSADMRDLVARRAADSRAAEAFDLFCYQARKGIGAFAAALGGLDTLVFSGGIGENAPEVRHAICEGLGFLGIQLDPKRNAAGAALISTDASPAAARVIPTDEETMIARETFRIIGRSA